jgi:HK97 family phage major capsid protein
MPSRSYSVTPNDFIRDGYAPFSGEIRSKMTDLRNKLADLAERGNPDPEQVKRYVAGIEKLIEAGEAETVERVAVLQRAASRGSVETTEPRTRTATSSPEDATRSAALREIERHKLDAPAADRLERVIHAEETPVHAAYIAAVASDAYKSAWRKVMGDPERATFELSNEERAALIATRKAVVQRDLTTGGSAGADGGYALPFSVDPTLILTNDGSNNVLRQIATVKQITQKSTRVVTTDGVQAAYGAEGSNVTEVQPVLARPEIIAERATAFVKGSFEIFADWAGINAELTRVFQDAKDNLEAEQFILGDGTDAPEGLLTGLTPAGGDVTDPDDLIAMQGALGARYQANARWLMNLGTINAVGQYVAAADTTFAPILSDNGNLLRKPVHEASYMPAGDVVYGDFRAGFVIVDRLGMSVELVRHIFDGSGNLEGNRGLLAIWRSGSAVVNADALVYYGNGS